MPIKQLIKYDCFVLYIHSQIFLKSIDRAFISINIVKNQKVRDNRENWNGKMCKTVRIEE
jgi:hypothetical protein